MAVKELILQIKSDEAVEYGSITPLVQEALERKKQLLAQGIEKTREELTRYEQKYGLSSEEFYDRFNASDEFNDSAEFMAWAGEYEVLQLLIQQHRLLRSIHIHAGE
jgi:hypothetical protein